MFSQFRQAVENFAPPPPRGSQDMARSGSPKPSTNGHNARNSSSSNARPKSTLEERLRAKVAAAESSRAHSSSPSPTTSVPVIEHPLSPTSTPLPDSPAISPAPTSSFDLDAPLSLASVSEVNIQSPTKPSPSHQEAPVSKPEPLTSPPGELNDTPTTHAEDGVTEKAGETPKSTASEPVEETKAEATTVDEPDLPQADGDDQDVESLHQRLKLVEQRFSDVSKSFKRLQAEKLAADAVLRELSPLETLQDADALRDYLQNMSLKAEISQDEIKRLSGKLQRQDERIEELRDTHRLESTSQSEQLDKYKSQLEEAEALLKASNSSTSQSEEDTAKRNAEMDKLQSEVEKAKASAKEEEEKRVKAISMLKAVRQKLIKAEKDKEDSAKELNGIRDKEHGEIEKERAEKRKLQHEIDAVYAERDKTVAGLRIQLERDAATLKDRHEKEVSAIRGQLELEAVTTKSAHNKELSSKASQISSLENSVNTLTREKTSIFDELQMRQAELESSQFHAESMQSQNTELQYQLRESQDRITVLREELIESQRDQESSAPLVPTTSAEDISRQLSAVEAKYELKVAELKQSLTAVEKERNEGEADWSRKLMEKTRETDELKSVLQSSAKTRNVNEEVVQALKGEIEHLKEEVATYQRQISSLQLQAGQVKDVEVSANQRVTEVQARVTALENLVEESKAREAQTRAHNKTLREEMRKVQSSAALLERQRNPGVGYWTSRQDPSSTDIRTSASSNSSDVPSRSNSPRPTASSPSANEEEVNLEYLRNVILQFLEHKEMRPNLVKVLSIILHFTPQETRRLIAKV